MNHLTVEIEDSFGSLLELAANNDVEAFKRSVDRDPSAIDEVGDWYGRKKVIEQRTPLMVAATYGSVDVLELIISLSSADVNRLCGGIRPPPSTVPPPVAHRTLLRRQNTPFFRRRSEHRRRRWPSGGGCYRRASQAA
ncbi:hypothetical protein HPP92_009582 [Vanilla planifolia]|uniref:Uncharacterized protein n=1 Tax=Vanilla planifolia TaxID=51239 RepID=A0A835R856_VANPL|nr:hypothetical protein HPP92_009582 [Vanilla planifolia]